MIVAFHDHGIPVRTIDLWETDTCCATIQHNDVWGNETMLRSLTRVMEPNYEASVEDAVRGLAE
jgi:hypothetical protein